MCEEVLLVVVAITVLFGSKSLQEGEEVDYSSESHNPCDATNGHFLYFALVLGLVFSFCVNGVL